MIEGRIGLLETLEALHSEADGQPVKVSRRPGRKP